MAIKGEEALIVLGTGGDVGPEGKRGEVAPINKSGMEQNIWPSKKAKSVHPDPEEG